MGTEQEMLTRNGFEQGVDAGGCILLKSSAYVVPVSRTELEQNFDGNLDGLLREMILEGRKLLLINRGKAALMTTGGLEQAKSGLLGGKLGMSPEIYHKLVEEEVLGDAYIALKSSPTQEKFDFAYQILPRLELKQLQAITDVIWSFLRDNKRKKINKTQRGELATELFQKIQQTYTDGTVAIPEDEQTVAAILRYFDAVQGLFTEKSKVGDIIRECEEELFIEKIVIADYEYDAPLKGLEEERRANLLCRKNFKKINTAFPHYIIDTDGTSAEQSILKITQADLYVLLMNDDIYRAWESSMVVTSATHPSTSTAKQVLGAVGCATKYSVT